MNDETYISIPLRVLEQYIPKNEIKEYKKRNREKKIDIRVYLEPRVKEQLKELSVKNHTTMSELVREAIELVYHFDHGKNSYTVANY